MMALLFTSHQIRTRYMFNITQTYVKTFEEKVSGEPEKNTRDILEAKNIKYETTI